jgi:putative FmdB family regulatory protein
MPTYEYVCKSCGHRFETWQSMTDDPLTICPVCGGELRKVFAPPAITFKGSGFYATDHGKQAKKGEGGAKKEAASTSKGSGSKDGSGSSGSKDGSGSSGSKDGSGSSGSKEGSGSSGSKDGGSSSGSKAPTSSKGSRS